MKTYYTVKEFKALSNHEIITHIKTNLKENLGHESFSKGQIISWNKSIDLIRNIFEKDNPNWHIFFEFLIPLSSGKRPDIILTNGVNIFIIEVKNKSEYTTADLDQITGYKLDLEFYHSTAKNFEFHPVLLLLRADDMYGTCNSITIVSPDKLKTLLLQNYQEFLMIHPKSLNDGVFKPVPGIMEYAKDIFKNKEIQTIEKGCFENSHLIISELSEIIKRSEESKEHSVVFISGAPGTGKSAIGLKTCFDHNGLYVSKNRQFADNLKKEIGSEGNIKTNHNFITEYSKSDRVPDWNVVVLDEAQRLWRKGKMSYYFGLEMAESELLVKKFISKEWCVLVVLIGNGQEIGSDESCDFYIWKDAMESSNKKWNVYGAGKVKWEFHRGKMINYHDRPSFNLTNSFRNFKTPNFPKFVDNLLDHHSGINSILFNSLKSQYSKLKKGGLKILITRNYDKALEYCRERYQDRPNSFCTLTSSASYINDLEDLNFQNSIVYDYNKSSKLEINDYLNNNGKIAENEKISFPLSEYSSIGFELQMPIVIWGLDYLWYHGSWNFDFETSIFGNTYLRVNTYRILLTRGRDGVVLFFPPVWNFNNTYEFFKELGADLI
ncbi:DNA/RNA helicase domain-containing protein [Aestuariivivens marinum]|uniref:DNA/RNA helicase domain-containing protein n=1 Tax=Aestuariivivens marinum TaxID=2913555 RepID=UPI001F5A57C5|nr:DNA/RNA helicase domain-containing protein [Aestuariivivens marinum]